MFGHRTKRNLLCVKGNEEGKGAAVPQVFDRTGEADHLDVMHDGHEEVTAEKHGRHEERYTTKLYVGTAKKPNRPRATAGVAARELFAPLEGQPMSRVRRILADSKYHDMTLFDWVEAYGHDERTIIRRPEWSKTWVKLPIRWTVEPTFSRLVRRPSKDRERSVVSSESFVERATFPMMLHRPHPSNDPTFHRLKVIISADSNSPWMQLATLPK